jgi:transcriptional regulator with XRE-family HTH domain
MSFGGTVREHRVAKGYGLNETAERLGISLVYLSRIEREHESPPRDELIERIAAILDLRLDDLFVKAERLPPICAKTCLASLPSTDVAAS